MSEPPIVVAARSDVGRVRDGNEDSFIVVSDDLEAEVLATRGRMLLVADGMGGARGGETASSMTAKVVAKTYYRHTPNLDICAALRHAIVAANTAVHEEANSDTDLRGMGSTCTVAVINDGRVTVGHVGDSRCYLIRSGSIRCLTLDHSKVAQMVRDGLISTAQAEVHPERNVILRNIGSKPTVEVDILTEPLQSGDRLVLCSDGLTGPVSDEDILRTVSRHPPAEAADILIEMANQGGGEDNITVGILAYGPTRRAPTTLPPAAPPTLVERPIEQPAQDESPAPVKRKGYRVMLLVLLIVVAVLGSLLAYLILKPHERPADVEKLPPKPAAKKPAPMPVQPKAPAKKTKKAASEPFIGGDEAKAPDSGLAKEPRPKIATTKGSVPAIPHEDVLDKQKKNEALSYLPQQFNRCPDFKEKLCKTLSMQKCEPHESIVSAIVKFQAKHRKLGKDPDGKAGKQTQKAIFGKILCPSQSN